MGVSNTEMNLSTDIARAPRPRGVRNVVVVTALAVLAVMARAHEVPSPHNVSVSDHLTLGLPMVNSVTDVELAQLGKRLFSDVRLSVDGKVSCATCHVPKMSFSDHRARAAGRQQQLLTRNTPSLLNVVYLNSLFWDGRSSDLSAQAKVPLFGPLEHGLPDERALSDIVSGDSAYVRAFGRAFQLSSTDRIGVREVVGALAAYENTLIAGGSSFDEFFYGRKHDAMTPAAVHGFELFRGRAGCASCHLVGQRDALFTDQQFHIGPGGLGQRVTLHLAELTRRVAQLRHSGDLNELNRAVSKNTELAALGRFVVSLDPKDIGCFKTPSLRNVAMTAPYMHDGRVKTLEEAIDLELYSRTEGVHRPIALTALEKRDLLEFLRALTSPYAATSTF